MTTLGIAASLVILWIAGGAVLAALDLRPRRVGLSSADLVTGLVLLYVVGVSQIALGWKLSVWPVYVVLAVALAVAVARGTVRLRRPAPPRIGIVALGAIVCASVLAGFLAFAGRDALRWDGWAIWGFRAAHLVSARTMPDLMFDAGVYGVANVHYPLGLPLRAWWASVHSGAPAMVALSTSGVLTFVLLPLLMWEGAKDAVPRWVAVLATVGVTCFVTLSTNAVTGYADYMVAVAIIGAALELVRSVTDGDERGAWRAAIYVALAASVKEEGLALTAVFVGVLVLFFGLMRRQWRGVLPALLPVLVMLPWQMILRTHGGRTRVETSIAQTSAGGQEYAVSLANRAESFLRQMIEVARPGSFFPVVVLVVLGLIALRRTRSTGLLAAWLLVAGYVSAAAASFLLLTAEDIHHLVRASGDRVFGAVIPAAVLLALVTTARVTERVHDQ